MITTMGATCPYCGKQNTHRVVVQKDGKTIKTYFECKSCGAVW